MIKPVSFPPQDLAKAAKAAYLLGWTRKAFEASRGYTEAESLLTAWACLNELQKKLDFYFHGRPDEEPEVVTQARRVFFRGLKEQLSPPTPLAPDPEVFDWNSRYDAAWPAGEVS